MRSNFVIIFLVVGLLGVVPPAQSGSPFTVNFNPGPAVVDECKTSPPDHWTAYTNDTGRNVKFEAVDMWLGMYRGAIYDVALIVEIVRLDGSWLMVGSFRWDHYADPDTPHQRYIVFPTPFTLVPGESVEVYAAKCFIEGTRSPLHPIVLLYLR